MKLNAKINAIEELAYENRPFMENEQYSVHLLSDKGIKQLLDKESYLRNYLRKVKPVMDEEINIPIKNEENQRQIKYNERKMDIKTLKPEIKSNKNRSNIIEDEINQGLVDKILKYFQIK